ncbi:hypothetical protein Pcac1_g18498 [Phytophthora cactorum]|uniref:Uncharacterized protein n=1 Tax=Phytophthora cactorum TaxID=29920 RepID=A0A8T1ASG6_9STRA|nr:hypothetical protein Pcac1_g18498 [Phytophthora cactorum]KAG2832335.1 hypothetical protein PC112_g6950 [Phytophthora cactorum]KAG2885866.1 hypothetical protein PC115_g20864 [Phytophthora cactorum]KAG2965860.1 hypothetical protein PC118_g19494 [Phytophthora cactorum]KAG3050144.1 hypothetical protein PC121_g18548 [Phytophthora cactorum]
MFNHVFIFTREFPLDHTQGPLTDRLWEATLHHFIFREPLLIGTWERMLDHV